MNFEAVGITVASILLVQGLLRCRKPEKSRLSNNERIAISDLEEDNKKLRTEVAVVKALHNSTSDTLSDYHTRLVRTEAALERCKEQRNLLIKRAGWFDCIAENEELDAILEGRNE